ncbi:MULTISPECIES: hypothetical protein [unclassified Streptomyces]
MAVKERVRAVTDLTRDGEVAAKVTASRLSAVNEG